MALKTSSASDALLKSKKSHSKDTFYLGEKASSKSRDADQLAPKTGKKSKSEESTRSHRKSKHTSSKRSKSKKESSRPKESSSSNKLPLRSDLASTSAEAKAPAAPNIKEKGSLAKRFSLRHGRKSISALFGNKGSSIDTTDHPGMLIEDNPLFDERNAEVAAKTAAEASTGTGKDDDRVLKSSRRSLSRLAVDWLTKSHHKLSSKKSSKQVDNTQLVQDLTTIITVPCSTLDQLMCHFPWVNEKSESRSEKSKAKSLNKSKNRLIRAGMSFVEQNQTELDRANPEKLCVLLHNLVLLLADQERYEEAEALCCQALAVMNCSSSKNRVPVTATSLHLWAGLLRAQGRDDEVAQLFLDYMEKK